MECEFCHNPTTKRAVTKPHWLDSRLYLVENVQAEVCTECGERYYHATTLDAIDALLRGKYPVKRELDVKVVSL